MSQTDMNVANASGATVRADINSHLDAIASNHSGATAPTTTFPNQWWFDTSANLMKQRDNANTAWVTVASKTGSGWLPYRNGTALGTASVVDTGTGSSNVPTNTQISTTARSWDADAYQTIDGNVELASLDGEASDTYAVPLGTEVSIVADVDGTLTLPSSGYGETIVNVYNSGTRSLTLSGTYTLMTASGPGGVDTKMDVLFIRRSRKNGADLMQLWVSSEA